MKREDLTPGMATFICNAPWLPRELMAFRLSMDPITFDRELAPLLGQAPVTKAGKRRLFSTKEVDALLERRAVR